MSTTKYSLALLTCWLVAFKPSPQVAITRERADELLAKLPAGDPWVRSPDASTIAWGESPTLHALADMYEATNDPHYLKLLARRGQQVLSHRDDRRNVADGSGKVRPGWSMASKYVVAAGKLDDVIDVRSTPSAYNNQTTVEVIPANGSFTLVVNNKFFKRKETFTGLSLDPSDVRFAEKVVNDPMAPYSCAAGEYTDKSNLIRVKVMKKGVLNAGTITLKPIPLAYSGYYGVIYQPMLRFAEHVKKDPALAALVPAADSFIVAATASYDDIIKRLWREGPGKGEGYFLTCEKGESFPADNVGAPFNFQGRQVCALLALHRLTGKKVYKEKAEKMCRMFKNRLRYNQQKDLYEWNYWFEPMTTIGWKPEDNISFNVKYFKPYAVTEDVSHGILDIAMVAAATEQGVVFDKTDLQRFANTLLVNVMAPDGCDMRRRVDGNGPGYPAYFNQLHGWLELAPGNEKVYPVIKQAYLCKNEESFVFCARLLKWEQKLR